MAIACDRQYGPDIVCDGTTAAAPTCASQAPECSQFHFPCRECGQSFLSSKACQSHERKKHNIKSNVNQYIGPNNRCPICKIQFANRVSALKHASEKRVRGAPRQTCNARLLAGEAPPFSPSTVVDLDAAAKASRQRAAQTGKTHEKVAFRVTRVTPTMCTVRRTHYRRTRINGKRKVSDTSAHYIDMYKTRVKIRKVAVAPRLLSIMASTKRRGVFSATVCHAKSLRVCSASSASLTVVQR